MTKQERIAGILKIVHLVVCVIGVLALLSIAFSLQRIGRDAAVSTGGTHVNIYQGSKPENEKVELESSQREELHEVIGRMRAVAQEEHKPVVKAVEQIEKVKPIKKELSTPENTLAQSNGRTHKIQMLNNGEDGAMVFQPGYLQIQPGDKVTFSPSSYGHNSQSIAEIIGSTDGQPEGSKEWKGEMSKPVTVQFDVPGIYLYACYYHYVVGHVGVIQVGNDQHNIERVKKAAEKLKTKMFSYPERVDNDLSQIK